MLIIRKVSMRWCPILTCDYCGREIDNAESALYLWFDSSSSRSDREMFHLHKGECRTLFLANVNLGMHLQDPTHHEEELRFLPRQIRNHIGMERGED